MFATRRKYPSSIAKLPSTTHWCVRSFAVLDAIVLTNMLLCDVPLRSWIRTLLIVPVVCHKMLYWLPVDTPPPLSKGDSVTEVILGADSIVNIEEHPSNALGPDCRATHTR